MKSYEFSAKNVDKAIKEGLTLLNKKQEDVDIKILSDGGLFKKAKVLITTDEPDENEEPKAEQKIEEKLENKPDKKEFVKPEEKHKVEEKTEIKTEVKAEEPKETEKKPEVKKEERADNKTSKEFVEGLLKALKIEGKVDLTEEDEISMVTLSGKDTGNLIGHRGDGLNALQYVCNVVEEKKNPKSKRVVIDIEGYKERREESLKGLAHRCANKVLKTQKPYKLEPMNAYERRIIHTELQTVEGITTISIGEEPNRKIVIDIEK